MIMVLGGDEGGFCGLLRGWLRRGCSSPGTLLQGAHCQGCYLVVQGTPLPRELPDTQWKRAG